MEKLLSFNFIELFQVIIRGVISFTILFFICKLLGKKQVSELSLFDYVIGISIGNFAAEITVNLDNNLIYGIFPIILFGFIAYFISKITMKNISIRRFIIGVPSIIINHGNIVYENLKKEKIDINDLLEQARNSGYFDLSEIEMGIMEVNGKINFMPKASYMPLIHKDMNIKNIKVGLCANVIIDGKIMNNNLNNIDKDEKWLLHELKINGINDIRDVLLATVDVNEKICIYKKLDEKFKNVLE